MASKVPASAEDSSTGKAFALKRLSALTDAIALCTEHEVTLRCKYACIRIICTLIEDNDHGAKVTCTLSHAPTHVLKLISATSPALRHMQGVTCVMLLARSHMRKVTCLKSHAQLTCVKSYAPSHMRQIDNRKVTCHVQRQPRTCEVTCMKSHAGHMGAA